MNTENVLNQLLLSLAKKRETKWPQWDGKTENFRSYIFELRVKIEEDRPLLGSNRAVCLGMIQTLPPSKKPRVDDWFERGGSNGGYEWVEFLNHFIDQFEDKQSIFVAGKELSRMKQGNRQPFTDFVKSYELKLAQCGGNKWNPLMKIVLLNNGLNEQLEKALIGIDMPPLDNYTLWRDKVREVAERLESHQTRMRPYYNNAGLKSDTNNSQVKDADGDTAMTGLNALLSVVNNENFSKELGGLLVGLGQTQKGKPNSKDTRPRAPWRNPKDFKKLIDEGLCTRCAKAGHFGNRCPFFRAAAAPDVNVNAAKLFGVEDLEEGKESP